MTNGNLLGKLFLILLIILCLSGIIFFGILLYKGYNDMFPNQSTASPSQEPTQQKQVGFWDIIKTILIVLLIITIVVLLLQSKKAGDIDFWKAADETFKELVGMGYPFQYIGSDNKLQYWKEENLVRIRSNKKISKPYVMPGSQSYYQGEDIRFGRVLLRYSTFPRSLELTNPDWDTNSLNRICVSVNPNAKHIFNRVTFLEPMNVKQCNQYIHKQVYGFEVSPEPSKKPSLIEARTENEMRQTAMELQKRAIAEGTVQQ